MAEVQVRFEAKGQDAKRVVDDRERIARQVAGRHIWWLDDESGPIEPEAYISNGDMFTSSNIITGWTQDVVIVVDLDD